MRSASDGVDGVVGGEEDVAVETEPRRQVRRVLLQTALSRFCFMSPRRLQRGCCPEAPQLDSRSRSDGRGFLELDQAKGIRQDREGGVHKTDTLEKANQAPRTSTRVLLTRTSPLFNTSSCSSRKNAIRSPFGSAP